jgi:hypothetical protein
VAWRWNGKEIFVSDEELEQEEEPSVLPARELMSLIGEEPAESEPDDEESEEEAPRDADPGH